MASSKENVDLGVMDDNNYAVIEGKKYPIKFVGPDANTYKHLSGCLAYRDPSGCCQCGVINRTSKIYGVYVPGTA